MYNEKIPTYIPTRATKNSAGYDLFYAGPEIIVHPGKVFLLNTNLKLNFNVVPKNGQMVCFLKEKSSSLNQVLAGVLDCDYEGPIKVKILPTCYHRIKFGDAICQAVFLPYISFDTSENKIVRGMKGFGEATKMNAKVLFK